MRNYCSLSRENWRKRWDGGYGCKWISVLCILCVPTNTLCDLCITQQPSFCVLYESFYNHPFGCLVWMLMDICFVNSLYSYSSQCNSFITQKPSFCVLDVSSFWVFGIYDTSSFCLFQPSYCVLVISYCNHPMVYCMVLQPSWDDCTISCYKHPVC